jgi:hypothetical protein
MEKKEVKLYTASSRLDHFCGRRDVMIKWYAVGREGNVVKLDEPMSNNERKSLNQFFSVKEVEDLRDFIDATTIWKLDSEEVIVSGDAYIAVNDESDKPLTFVELLETESFGLSFPFKIWGVCNPVSHVLTDMAEEEVDELALYLLQKETGRLRLTDEEVLEGLEKKITVISYFYEALQERATTFLEEVRAQSTNTRYLKIHLNQVKKPY